MSVTEELVEVAAAEIGQSLGALRTIPEQSVAAMMWSLKRHGQLTPVVVARMPTGLEMVDGFKRLRAVQSALDTRPLRCRLVTMSRRAAKVAMYCLNQGATGFNEVEEALLVRSLYREERMNQVQIAQALGRHKTWVCRRLQLVERLADRAQEAMRVGLLRATAARSLAKLPRGNQMLLLDAVARQKLSTRQLTRIVELYEKAVSPAEARAILGNPEGALLAKRRLEETPDERLSPLARRAVQQIGLVERVALSLAGYLETTYPTAANDHEFLLPWLNRLRRSVGLLGDRLSTASSAPTN